MSRTPTSRIFRSRPSSRNSISFATTCRSRRALSPESGIARIVLKRFVNGAEGEAFYQKRAPAERPPWLRTVTLSFPFGPHRGRGRRR